MRTLLVAVAGLVTLLAAALLVAPRFVDWNKFKPEIAALVERATGHPLAIDGDIAFSLLPTPTLSASGVRVGNPPGSPDPDLIRLKSLDARIAFWPLLGGRVVVESIALVQPVVIIDAAAAEPLFGRTGLEDRLSFDRIIVVDGSLLWRGADATTRIDKVNAEILAGSMVGPFRVNGDAAWHGLSWRVEGTTGPFSADAATSIALTLGVRGGGATLRLSGTATPGGSETWFAGRLRGEANRLREVLVAAGLSPDLPAPLGQPMTIEASVQAGRMRIALNDLALTLGDDTRAVGTVGIALQPRPALDLTLAISRLDLERWMAAPAPTSTGRPSASIPDPADRLWPSGGTIDLTIDALLWRGGVIRQARLAGLFDSDGLTVKQAAAQLPGGSDVALFGRLALRGSPRFDGQLEGGADNLRSLLDWFQVDLAALPPDRLRRVSVTTGLALDADRIELTNVDLQFDASRLTGRVIVARGARPAFGANLRLDRINLEAYLPRASAKPTPGGVAAGSREPLDWLTAFDANLQLRVEQLTYDTLPGRGVLVDATLERGTLTLHDLTIDDIAGTRASLVGTVRRTRWPAEAELSLSAEAADPSRLLQLLGYEAANSALGPFALSMTSAGPLDQLQLALDGQLAGGGFNVTGTTNLIGPALDAQGQLTLRHPEAVRLLQLVAPAYRPVTEGLGPFELTGMMSLSGSRFALPDATLKLGPSSFTTGVAADIANPRLGLTLHVAGSALVLDPLLPRRAEAPAPTALGPDLWAALGAAPTIGAALASVDMDAAFEFGALDYRGATARDVTLALALRDHGLTVSRLAAGWLGGRLQLTGEFGWDQPAPSRAITFALKDGALGELAGLITGAGGFEGRCDLDLRFADNGAAPADRLKSLTGSGRLSARDGAIPGFDLESLNDRLRLVDPPADLPQLVAQDLTAGRTGFTSLDGTLALRAGVLATDDAKLVARDGTADIRGRLDLAAREADIGLTLHLAGEPKAPGVTLHIAGPLERPVRSYDVKDLIAFLGAAPEPVGPRTAPPTGGSPPGAAKPSGEGGGRRGRGSGH